MWLWSKFTGFCAKCKAQYASGALIWFECNKVHCGKCGEQMEKAKSQKDTEF